MKKGREMNKARKLANVAAVLTVLVIPAMANAVVCTIEACSLLGGTCRQGTRSNEHCDCMVPRNSSGVGNKGGVASPISNSPRNGAVAPQGSGAVRR